MKKFFKFLGIIIIISIIYLAGYSVGHRNIEFEKGFIPKVTNTDFGKPTDVDFSLFWQAWDLVKSKYFGEMDVQKMVYGAISGMVHSLKDPYTMFLDPSDAKRFSEDLQGKFDGIGAELEAKDGALLIVAPLKGSPAEKAGLQPQDIILKIDGQDVSEMTFSQAVDKIRGKKGTTVTLTIFRKGLKESKEIKITRDTIVVKSVEYEIKNNDILYLKINQFGDDTLDLVKEALDFSTRKNVKGIVVDLRNNPGGYLQDAADILSLFIDKGQVAVIERGREGTESVIKTSLAAKAKDKTLLVLINEGSASASEIFGGAIQDYGRGKLVGKKSFGKGSVQALEALKDGSELKITTNEWLTPNRRQINKKGIKPDIEIELTEDDKNNNRDPQLDRAMEEVGK